MAYFRLANPVDASKALFNLVRVPWQIIVHHQMSALKVNAFAGGIVGNQDKQVPVLHEPFDDLAPFLSGHPTVNDIYCIRPAKPGDDLLTEILEGIFGLREYDQLASIPVRIEHQFVIENPIKLLPLRVLARAKDIKGHAFKALEGLNLQF